MNTCKPWSQKFQNEICIYKHRYIYIPWFRVGGHFGCLLCTESGIPWSAQLASMRMRAETKRGGSFYSTGRVQRREVTSFLGAILTSKVFTLPLKVCWFAGMKRMNWRRSGVHTACAYVSFFLSFIVTGVVNSTKLLYIFMPRSMRNTRVLKLYWWCLLHVVIFDISYTN